MRALVPNSDDAGTVAVRDLQSELRRDSPLFHAALRRKVLKDRGVDLPEADLKLKILQTDEIDFRAETNLQELLTITPEESHKLVEASMLAIGSLCLRLEEMKTHEALSGLTDEDLPIFAEKFALLTELLSPTYPALKAERTPLQSKETALGTC